MSIYMYFLKNYKHLFEKNMPYLSIEITVPKFFITIKGPQVNFECMNSQEKN